MGAPRRRRGALVTGCSRPGRSPARRRVSETEPRPAAPSRLASIAGLRARRAPPRPRGWPRKPTPKARTKQASGSAPVSASAAGGDGDESARWPGVAVPRPSSGGSGRAATRRRSRSAAAGRRSRPRRPGRATAVRGIEPDQPAQPLQVARAGPVCTAPAPRKRRPLKRAWLRRWKQRRGERQRRRRGVVARTEA